MSLVRRELQTSGMAASAAPERIAMQRLGWETPRTLTVDPGLAELARHHSSTREEFESILEFVMDQMTMRQLDLVVRLIGPRLPLNATAVHVERRSDGRILRSAMWLAQDYQWVSGRLIVPSGRLPETVVAASVGRSLRSIIGHPYVPDLPIGETWTEGRFQAFVPVRPEEKERS